MSIIALSGTHGTGKTTLVKEIQERVVNYPLDDNDAFSHSGVLFRNKLMELLEPKYLQIFNTGWFDYLLNSYEDSLSDRCVIDPLCYAREEYDQGRLSLRVLKHLEGKTEELVRKYDHIFWLRPEFVIEDSGTRPIDLEYQKRIDKHFEYYFDLFKVQNVHRLTGSVEERLYQVKQILNYV